MATPSSERTDNQGRQPNPAQRDRNRERDVDHRVAGSRSDPGECDQVVDADHRGVRGPGTIAGLC
jgi:hypothetical protein